MLFTEQLLSDPKLHNRAQSANLQAGMTRLRPFLPMLRPRGRRFDVAGEVELVSSPSPERGARPGSNHRKEGSL